MLVAVTNVAYAAPFIGPLTRSSVGFRIEGRDVIGPDGSKVLLRGVNKSGLEYSAFGYDMDFATFARMKSWGMNVFRLPLAPAYAIPGMCGYTSTYLKTVDQVVAYAEQLKMLVVLDDHFGTGGLPCGVGDWINNQKAPDLFNQMLVKTLAVRYKDRPYVAIDLYNEPHDTDWNTWRNGGLVDTYVGVGMQQMLDTVRAAGFGGLVFATGRQWGNDLTEIVTKPLLRDANVVYAAHAYPFDCDGATIPQDEPYVCRGRTYPPFVTTQIAPAVAVRPVMLTEFGTNREIPIENEALIGWAASQRIGWMAWLWCSGKMADFCLLQPDGSGNASAIGKPIEHALAFPGA